jgi:hypothetical protein
MGPTIAPEALASRFRGRLCNAGRAEPPGRRMEDDTTMTKRTNDTLILRHFVYSLSCIAVISTCLHIVSFPLYHPIITKVALVGDASWVRGG